MIDRDLPRPRLHAHRLAAPAAEAAVALDQRSGNFKLTAEKAREMLEVAEEMFAAFEQQIPERIQTRASGSTAGMSGSP